MQLRRLRRLLLDGLLAHTPDTKLRFDCAVSTVLRPRCGISGRVRPRRRLDACGVYSPLRHLRVLDEGSPRWRGLMLLYDTIADPETLLPRQALLHLDQCSRYAIDQGFFFGIQRFGHKVSDLRASLVPNFFRDPDRHRIDNVFVEAWVAQASSR